jgi:hypothetical protein
MKTLVNKSRKPIRIPLPGGHTLFLGPGRSGQIADRHAALPAVAKLIDDGTVEVAGESAQAGASASDGGHVHEGTHGHAPRKVVRPRGDR